MKTFAPLTLIGLVFMLVGISIFVLSLMRILNGTAIDPLTKVPGTIHAELPEEGRYYIWDNHWTDFEGESVKYPDDCPEDVRVLIQDPNGQEFEFVRDTDRGWSIGNNAKSSIGFVDVPSKTDLQIVVDDVDRDRIFSVSNRTMKQELWIRLGGLGYGIAIGMLGITIVLISLLTGTHTEAQQVHA